MTERAIDLHVPVFGQREAECGNTSLKSVCWFLGKRLSAKYLARLSGASADGIDHVGLVDAARRTGAAVFERTGGSIAELRSFLNRHHPMIVGWWSQERGDGHFDEGWSLAERRERDCSHFSVVSGIAPNRILLMDPQWITRRGRLRVLGRRWMSIQRFRQVWYDLDTPAYRRVERWYMVVHDDKERFAQQGLAGVDYPPLRTPR